MQLSSENIRENVHAYLEFEDDPGRQMPDPLCNRDLHWLVRNPPKTHALIADMERQHVLNPAGVAWGSRKANRTPRDMVLQNPYTDLATRIAMAAVAEQTVNRQTDLVIAGRLELKPRKANTAAVLTTQGHGEAHDIFRQRRDQIIQRDPPVGMITDIQAFYPSVTPREVERALLEFAPVSTASAIRLILEKHAIDTGTGGLPIGPETSAWLSNIVLAAADGVLRRFVGVEALRWSDDLILVDGVQSLVEECFDAWQRALQERGLTVSLRKTDRSWDLGISGGALVAAHSQSMSDIGTALDSDDWPWLAGDLLDQLRCHEPNRARLNRLFGVLTNATNVELEEIDTIIDLMLSDPETWEESVPRARGFFAAYADGRQREGMIHAAKDLDTDGIVASEQVVALCRASAEARSASNRIASGQRGRVADELLNFARANNCVPVRGWARKAAHVLDPYGITRETIDTGEFADLHPFEQRWAIAFADPQRHHSWLEKQRDAGRWPTTAAWRLATIAGRRRNPGSVTRRGIR